jgi:hypothetical protein
VVAVVDVHGHGGGVKVRSTFANTMGKNKETGDSKHKFKVKIENMKVNELSLYSGECFIKLYVNFSQFYV